VVFIGPGYLEDIRKLDELRRIIERATTGDLTILWFLESRCAYRSTGIDRFIAAHDITKPLDTLSVEEFNEVYRVAAEEFAKRLRASEQQDEPPVEEETPPKNDLREDINIGVHSSTRHRLVDVATGTAFFLSRAGDTTIGRADPVAGIFPDIDLTVVDTSRSVNRRHAKIVRSGSEYSLVEEVGTMNGTYVNDQRIPTRQPVGVYDGDLIKVGLIMLKAVLDDDVGKVTRKQNTDLRATTKTTTLSPLTGELDVSSRHHIVDVTTGTKFFLSEGDETTIGRADPATGILPDIDLTLVDTNRTVSRRHAKIIRSGDEYFLLEEVGTVNGTFVNDQRIPTGMPVTIHNSDSITIGLIRLNVRLA
jgi:pSer/pThr/pTyr-binding forkhead associated (FHA) protein